MPAPFEVLAVLAVLANAVVYGTDVFGALVLRPAVAAVDDRTLTQLLGHVHRVADRRIAACAIGGLGLAAATTVVAAGSGRGTSAVAAGVATLALIAFAVVYTRISKPVNVALTAAAVADRVPADARALQARWDSVIDARVALQTVALLGLLGALVAA
jgi:hypothetical protein